MKQVVIVNALLAILLTAVPVVAMFVAQGQSSPSGIGFAVLLYEPFDYAYLAFAAAVFSAVNVRFAVRRWGYRAATVGVALVVSSVVTLIWFLAAVVIVAQVHSMLGGQL